MQNDKDSIDPSRLESARAEISTRLPLVLRTATDGIHILDRDGFLVEMSDSFCRMLGYSPNELAGRHVSLWDARWSGPELHREVGQNLAKSGQTVTIETLHRHRDGHLFPVEIRATAIDLESGSFLYCSSRDVSERKEFEKKLQSALDQLRATLEAIPDLLFETDSEGRFHFYHSARAELLALPPEHFLGKTMAETLPPEVAEIGLSAIRKAGIEGQAQGSYSLDLPDGPHWFDFSVVRKKRTEDSPRFLVVSRDVTAQKTIENRIRQLSGLNLLLARASQAMAEASDDRALLQSLCDLAVQQPGIRLASIGKPDSEGRVGILAASGATGFLSDRDCIISVNPDLPEGRGPAGLSWRDGEPRFNHRFSDVPDGTPWKERALRYGLHTAAALPLKRQGILWGLLMLYGDSADPFDLPFQNAFLELARNASWGLERLFLRRREEILAARETALLENTVSGIALVRAEDRTILHLNARLLSMLGYDSPNQLLGQSTRLLYPGKEEFDRIGQIYERPTPLTIQDVRLKRKDGSSIVCDISFQLVEKQEQRTVAATFVDVSDRNQQTERLVRLSEFTTLLAKANEAILTATDESSLLETLANLAVRHAPLALIWIGRPDDTGAFRFLVSAGTTGYLEGIRVLSTPGLPEGEGPAGKVWREGRAFFNNSFSGNLSAWAGRGDRFGLNSSAVLPVFRGGRIWAVLAVYSREAEGFDPELVALLDELARNLSRGLDRIDLLSGQQLLSDALAAIGEGVTITDQQERVIYSNKTFSDLTGYLPEEIAGKNMKILQGSGTAPETVDSIRQALRSGNPFQGSIQNYRKDGSTFWNLLTITPVRNTSGEITHFVGVQRDITPLVDLNHRLEHEALHDRLTGLPNRKALEFHLERAVARARRSGQLFSVGMIDLDDFKTVNDSRGHEAGDRLLQELSARFREILRETDFIARLGGDEFVVVFDDLSHPEDQIDLLMDRLHKSVESPFEVLPGQSVSIGMTLGLALYPSDGEDGDSLLRHADAAMYQAKANKGKRPRWWQRGKEFPPEPTEPFDPYGSEASALLSRAHIHFERIIDRFVDSFYDELEKEAEIRSIFLTLDNGEKEALKNRQAEHLRFILGRDTSRESLLERARTLGEVHGLTGVTSGMLTRATSLYMRLLLDHFNTVPLTASDRYRVFLIAEFRLQDDIQVQFQSASLVTQAYFSALSAPLCPPGSLWSDARHQEIERLGSLPGIQAALLLRPDSGGIFVAEDISGSQAPLVSAVLGSPEYTVPLIFDHPEKETLAARVFRTRQIETTPSLLKNPKYGLWWHSMHRDAGIRSALLFPLSDTQKRPVGVISLAGHYPNQFESLWMKQFARGLEQRWEQIWSLCNEPSDALGMELSSEYRKELFEGGLVMLMQPVVDLESGRMVSVESLARLKLQDGTLISPQVFLPLLGESELDRLFRLTLDQSLEHLAHWENEGLSLEISVNLSPGTLLDPDCPRWVSECLDRHSLPPSRLTLEILETHKIAGQAQERALRSLVELGVKIAMDDLGSGYSSLQRLSGFPFDELKVDQGILSKIRLFPVETLGVIGAILQIGQELGRTVVVEGVEDAGVLEAVGILGARYVQGFALARPMEADRIPSWSSPAPVSGKNDPVRSYLGALAYHWRSLRRGRAEAHPTPLAECPLTPFLERLGLGNLDPYRWHRDIHGPGKEAASSGKKLTLWLIERVSQE